MPRWLLWCVLALLFFGGWAVAPKALPPEVSPYESQALSTIGLLPILAVLCFSKNFRSYPLVTVALALVFLREKPRPLQVWGVALALAAIYVFNPLEGTADWRSIGAYVVVPIGSWGVAGLLQKISTNHASSELSCFWFHAAFLPAAGVILLTRREVGAIHSPREWIVFVLIGLLFALGNLALLASFGSGGKASIVTPLSGLYSVVTIPLAMLFGERAGRREGGGIALALIAVVLLSWERRKETGDAEQTS